MRKNCGMTQKELTEKSGTSLRMVQLYEQRKQDIRKAEAQTLVNLSRVLGCGVLYQCSAGAFAAQRQGGRRDETL